MSVTRLVVVGAICAGAATSARAQLDTSERLEAMMIASDRDPSTFPMQEERLAVTIDHQHATSTLTQVYLNRGTTQIEGRYKLRPGLGTHVEGFAYWNGEAKVVGEVFERQTARQVYDQTVSRRRDPGLLEEDGEGAFAFKVFPIAPSEKKRVEVRWAKWLERHGQTVRYQAPLTRPDAEVTITLNGPIKNVRSPSHKLHVETVDPRLGGGLRLRSDGARGGAHDLLLEWDVDEPVWTPDAFVQPGSGPNDGWFALSLAAPDALASAAAGKDVTIVIDRSGSMEGDPMEHAKAAAADMIRRLPATDRVDVISFSDEVDPLFKTPQTLDADNRQRAITFVNRLHAGGGTDIALALSTAIGAQDAKAEGRARVVVFMTDGQSEVDKAIQAAHTDTKDVRLFTLGLGKDVNRPLLQRLAALKRGSFVYIPDAKSIEPIVGRLASRIAKPLLLDVSVDVEGAQAVRIYPRTLPDLFAEDELLVTGRLRGTGTARFVIKGKLGGKEMTYTKTVDLGRASPRPWVGELWAQSRVEHLLEEISLGASAPEVKTEVIELAVAYNFVTPYTAFLAIPESELGAARPTVEAARAAKAKILADNPDAAGLRNPQQQVVAVQGSAPTIDPGSTTQGVTIDGRSFSAPTRTASADADDDGERRSGAEMLSGTASRRHGCAGCATGGSGPGSALVALLAALLLHRRKRSHD